MFKFDFKLLPAVTLALALSSTAWALPENFDKGWVDISAPQNSKGLVADKNLDNVVKPDTNVFLGSYQVHFATQAEYKVQKASQSVGITGWSKLLGVPDQVFQEITDEAAAYAEQKWAEVYGTAIPESEVAKHEKWADLQSKFEAKEYVVETKRGLTEAVPVGGTHYKKFTRNGVPPKSLPTMKGNMALYKIQLANKFAMVNAGYGISYDVVGDGSGFSRGNDTVTATLGIEPLLSGSGGAIIMNSKIKASGTYFQKGAAIVDSSWVKSVVKKDGPVWEIEADPVKFKEASLKILKGMVDLETDRAKAIKAGGK